MTPINPRIGIGVTKIPRTTEKFTNSPTPSGILKGRNGGSIPTPAGVFDIENTYLRVTGACNYCSIVRLWHEFDREDVGLVTGEDGSIECKRSIGGFGLIRVDIEMLIIRAGS
jgi:hypothetical protein